MRFRPALTAILLCAAGGCMPSLIKAQEAPQAEIVIDGSRIFPESITSDSAGNIYVGSNPGIVYRARAGEAVASPWISPDEENGLNSVFGVLVDEARGLLWACSNPPMGANAGGGPAIKTFALADGSFIASHPFPADAGPAMCNDMTIAENGDVYASETLGGRIMFLRNGAEAFESWAADPEFASIDGISFSANGTLYANAIQRNTLLRVGIESDGRFGNVEVVKMSHMMGGPDGLRPLPDGRMLQSEGNAGTITVLAFADDGSAQVEVIADGIDYASSVTFANGRAYYPEGKLGFLFGPKAGQDPGPFVIRSVAVPEAQ